MFLFSRSTSLKRDVFRFTSTLCPLSRRFQRPTSGKVALFLAAFPLLFALFSVPPTFADNASLPNNANNANNADRLFPLFSQRRRPALLCELAGIPAQPLNWESWTGQAPLFPVLASSATTPSFRLADVSSSSVDAAPSRSPQLSQTTQTVQTVQLTSPPRPLPSASFLATSASTAPIVRGAYLSNLAIAPFRGRVFAYADGSWGRQDEQNESPFSAGFDVASFGGGVGQDWRLSKNAIWGLGLQGRSVQLDPAASIYDAEINSLAGFLRLSLFGPLWRLDLSIGAAQNWNEQNAEIGDATKFSSTQWNYEAEFGVRFDKGYTRVEPLINVRVITLQEPADAERRLIAHGRPDDYSDASYRLKLGSRFSWEYATRLATLKPYLTATWAHEFGDRALYVVGENTPFPIVYRYAKHRMARDRLDLGGGVDAALRDTVDLFFRYDVEFAKEYVNYLFYAGFHKKF